MKLTKINIDSNIKNYINSPIPSSLISTRQGGGKTQLSYLSGNLVVDMLNEAFGIAGWDWIVDKEWVRESTPKQPNKYEIQQGKTEPIPQGPVAHVLGHLVVRLQDETGRVFEVTKSGYGGKAILGGQSEQEDIYKSAGTYALKKAASLFGIGLELYRNEAEQNYFNGLANQWDDEKREKYAEEITFFNSLLENSGAEAVNTMIQSWSNGSIASYEQLYPTELVAFVNHCQNNKGAKSA